MRRMWMCNRKRHCEKFAHGPQKSRRRALTIGAAGKPAG